MGFMQIVEICKAFFTYYFGLCKSLQMILLKHDDNNTKTTKTAPFNYKIISSTNCQVNNR